MEVVYLLVPIALLFVIVMGAAVVWAITSGQYDDLDRAGEEFLLDDDDPDPEPPARDHRH